mmetsp:Transcript_15170/g.48514  ORF Transcript_15170/g.48514 Transcript_15170/m.48514 type:complete len:200 (-) Transcript_15170:507-1106(-)
MLCNHMSQTIPSGNSSSSQPWIVKPQCTELLGNKSRRLTSMVLANLQNLRKSMSISSHSPDGSLKTVPLFVIRQGFPLYLRTVGSRSFGTPTSSRLPTAATAFIRPEVLEPPRSVGKSVLPALTKSTNIRRSAGHLQDRSTRIVSGFMRKMVTMLTPASSAGCSPKTGPTCSGSCATTQSTRGNGQPGHQPSSPFLCVD